jgi:hypothetical protein
MGVDMAVYESFRALGLEMSILPIKLDEYEGDEDEHYRQYNWNDEDDFATSDVSTTYIGTKLCPTQYPPPGSTSYDNDDELFPTVQTKVHWLTGRLKHVELAVLSIAVRFPTKLFRPVRLQRLALSRVPGSECADRLSTGTK